MREYSAPRAYAVPASGSLTDDLRSNAESHPDRPAFARHSPGGWEEVTWGGFLAEVRRTAKGLIAAGVGPGERVALLSRTRYEWTLLDYATWYVGAVTVPIYPTAPAEQVRWILAHSGASAVVVEHAEQVQATSHARATAAELRHTWSLEDNAVDVLGRLGEDVDDALLESRRAAVGPRDLATLIYTSGTTGAPKGCVLTHGNLMFEASATVGELERLFAGRDASTLLFLPLAHVLTRVFQVGAVRGRVRVGYAHDVRNLLEDFASFRPTFLVGVPRVFERVFNAASQEAHSEGRGRTFDRAAEAAITYSRALDSGRPGAMLRARHTMFDRLVYASLRERLGGSCSFAVSGGAPLGERLAHFYRGIGITVLEGYGLTETCGAATLNVPDATKLGTVGRPIPGTTVRVGEDGELLVRGPQVIRGYWQDEESTAAVVTSDGWCRTGDIGEIDAEGFLRVTGRANEILVTAGGKTVAPAALEDRLRAHPLVSQCLVVGDGRPYLAALVTLDGETLPAWAERHGSSGSTGSPEQLARDPELVAEIQRAVDQVNSGVSWAESIRRFAILPGAWTEEGGQLTPSLKLRRNAVMREVRLEVDSLYDRV